MKRISVIVVFALLGAFALASCGQTVKGGEVKSEAEWRAGFETLVNPQGGAAGLTAIASKDGLEKITAATGFKSKTRATAAVEFLLNGEKKAVKDLPVAIVDVIKANKDALGVSDAMIGMIENGMAGAANMLETVYDVGDNYGVDIAVNHIATPNWEIQYTDNGKNADVEKDEAGNITSFTPAVMATYIKGDDEYWADRDGDTWGTWYKTKKGDTLYESWVRIFALLQNSYAAIGDGPDGNGKYTVTLYCNPKQSIGDIDIDDGFGSFLTKEPNSDDDIKLEFNVWFGEDDKKVKKLSIDGAALSLDMSNELIGGDFPEELAQALKQVLNISFKVTMTLDMDVEYPDSFEYEVPTLLDEMK
ncbi:MAG TPA: hypothetical protein DCO86_03750 [Spirochaetaceae bacterium]|nr:hypothetical protein [Spirochaetaceae bacterium]